MKTTAEFEETPIQKISDYAEALEYFHEYSPRDKDIKDIKYETGELLDLIVEVCHQEPNADGYPTDKQCLQAINNALYYHYLL